MHRDIFEYESEKEEKAITVTRENEKNIGKGGLKVCQFPEGLKNGGGNHPLTLLALIF